jgi:hypothetical protein
LLSCRPGNSRLRNRALANGAKKPRYGEPILPDFPNLQQVTAEWGQHLGRRGKREQKQGITHSLTHFDKTEEENMTALTKIRLYMLAGLLLSASAVWGQSDHIHGDAVSCTIKSYDKHGGTVQGYYIRGAVTAPPCGLNGAATSKSSATIGPPAITGNAVTTTAKSGDGADSTSLSTDYVVLTPPSGWTGGPVTVKLKTSYTFSVKGATSTTPGTYSIDWLIDNEVEKTESSASNGNGTLNIAFPIVVVPDKGFYSFEVGVIGDTDAIAGPNSAASVSIKTSFIDFVLPQGWTCSWASNGASCDAP